MAGNHGFGVVVGQKSLSNGAESMESICGRWAGAWATIWPLGNTPHAPSAQPARREAEDLFYSSGGDSSIVLTSYYTSFSVVFLSQGTSIKAIPNYFTNLSYFSFISGFVSLSAGISLPFIYLISNILSLVYLISYL